MIVFAPSAIAHNPFSRTRSRWVSHLDPASKQAARDGALIVCLAYHPTRGLVLLKAKRWVSAKGRELFFPRRLKKGEEVAEALRTFNAPRRATVQIQVHLEPKENKS